MTDDNGRTVDAAIKIIADEEVAGDGHPVLVLEFDRLDSHDVTSVEVVGSVRHILCSCWHCVGNHEHTERGGATSHHHVAVVGC